jgi:molecular chaperone HtpG
VDEWVVGSLAEFEGKPLASVARGDVDLSKIEGGAQAKEPERQIGEHRELLRALKSALDEKVKDVRISARLTDSAACLVSDEREISANLARILKSVGQDVPKVKPILEINPGHAIVKRLQPADARFPDWARLIFDQALLAEGGTLDDPAGFVRLTNELMLGARN